MPLLSLPIGLDPVALSLGGVEIRWYGLTAAAAVAVAVILALKGARRAGIAPGLVEDAALWVGIAAIVGGRVLYVLQNELAQVASHPMLLIEVWHGGLSFYGGLVAGLVALAVWARRRAVGLGRAADIAAPAAAAGQAVGHIGCLIGGDSYGLPTTGLLAVVYSSPRAMAPQGVPLAPTQLYEAVGLGVLALALWLGRDRLERIGPGATAAAYLLGNAALRFGLFFLRDDVVVLGGLKVAQLIAIAVAATGAAWLVAAARRSRPAARGASA